jgi:hypothetical protein
VDNNCDGSTDERLSTDEDGDGHYLAGSCAGPADDCDDDDPNVHPDAPENCNQNGKDDDCDGDTDGADSDCTSLNITLTAAPSSGVEPLTYGLSGTVTNATGAIVVYAWCDCADATADLATARSSCGAEDAFVADQASYSFADLCIQNAGQYTPKALVEDTGDSAQAQDTVNVSAALEIVGGIEIKELVVDSGGFNPFSLKVARPIWEVTPQFEDFGIVDTTYHFWEVTHREGDCVYYTQVVEGNCDPLCDPDGQRPWTAWCTPADVCEDFPGTRPAGTIRVTGTKVALTFQPGAEGKYGSTAGPADLFDPGDTVTAAADGGQTAAFSLAVDAPEVLQPAITCLPALQAGQDYAVTWQPPATGGSFIRYFMIAFKHSGHSNMVVCETEDDGSLTVPASMIDRYLQDQTINDSIHVDRVMRSVVELDNGYHYVLELSSSRVCWNGP